MSHHANHQCRLRPAKTNPSAIAPCENDRALLWGKREPSMAQQGSVGAGSGCVNCATALSCRPSGGCER
eukprot:14909114-Alexandrium_andersonii.AAC.1